MIYVNNNICIENNPFRLRIVEFKDAKDLLEVYSVCGAGVWRKHLLPADESEII